MLRTGSDMGKYKSIKRCQFCGSENIKVVQTESDEIVIRTRACMNCRMRTKTIEIEVDDLTELERSVESLNAKLSTIRLLVERK